MKIRCTLALTVAAALVLAVGAPAQDAKKELAALQGKWKATKIEIEGKEIPADELGKLKISVQGDKFIAHKENNEQDKNLIKLDPAKKPKQIDLTPQSGPSEGMTLQGIYALEGDTFKMCLGLPGTSRPDAFAGGDMRVLITLQRVKK
jgi:uncharacterized protein (TIGR03067 family)